MVKHTIYPGLLMGMILACSEARADAGKQWSERVSIGAKAGLELASFRGADSQDGLFLYSYKPGLHAGIHLEFRVNEMLAAGAEVLFSQKGARLDSNTPAANDGTYVTDYLVVPILAKFGVPLSGRVHPYATLGPAVAILLNQEYVQTDGARFQLSTVEPITLSVVLGLGTRIDAGISGAITFDARYDFGLTARSEMSDATNASFYFTLGYQTDLSIFSGGS
jgi:opacity protein-like surface antigen